MPKADSPSAMGSTFAERKAAREGADFKVPAPVETGNTTFAERASKPTKAEPKQVDKDADEVEDKAVKSASSKRTAKKS